MVASEANFQLDKQQRINEKRSTQVRMSEGIKAGRERETKQRQKFVLWPLRIVLPRLLGPGSIWRRRWRWRRRQHSINHHNWTFRIKAREEIGHGDPVTIECNNKKSKQPIDHKWMKAKGREEEEEREGASWMNRMNDNAESKIECWPESIHLPNIFKSMNLSSCK